MDKGKGRWKQNRSEGVQKAEGRKIVSSVNGWGGDCDIGLAPLWSARL